VHSPRSNILISILLWLLIAAAAWPVFVAVNLAISFFVGEGSVLDTWNQVPKRTLITDFINGYKSSALIAALLGLVAVVDFQLLSRNKLTGYIAGILVPVCCIGIAFWHYPEPSYVLPGFALTGLALWILYKFIDIGFRLRRVG